MNTKTIKSLLVVHLLLLLGNGVYAQDWVSLDNTKRGKGISLDVIKSDVSIHQVRITLHGFYDKTISINSTDYHHLFFDESIGLMNVGEPQLPTISQLFAIPEGAKYEYSLTEEIWQDVEMGKIFPTQRNCKDNNAEHDFTINEDVYRQEVYAPFVSQMGTEQNWRNIRNVNVKICPFKYYPRQNKLSVLTSFVITLNFTDISDKSLVREKDIKRAVKWQMFNNNIRDFPIRKEMEKASSSNNDYDYLIIVGNIPDILNSQALQDFKIWKTIKGYKPKIVSTTTIDSTTSAIKSYIAQEYENYGIDYVLFIGDCDKIPLKTQSIYTEYLQYAHGDYWYGCLTGGNDDYFAEIPIGRFSTNTLSEFQNMVNKTIAYERFYNGDSKKILLVAHKQNPSYSTYYQKCCEAIRDAPYNYMSPFSLSFSTAFGASSATNSDVVDSINNGMNIVNYRGHGDYDCWLTWNNTNECFANSAIEYIDSTSIFFNVCCLTGNIREEPCMMEKLTRSPEGAIACLAATELIWRFQGNTYNQYLFSKLINNYCNNIGELSILAHNATITDYSNNDEFKNEAIFNAWSFLCGGDPSLEIWTYGPFSKSHDNITVSESNGVMTINTDLSILPKISVLTESFDVIERYNVEFNTCSFNIPSGNFYVVINNYNSFPYILYFSSSNYLQNTTVYANSHYHYRTTPLKIGYDVTNNNPYGVVLLKPGSKVTINNGTEGVTIKNGFECKKGAELIIE